MQFCGERVEREINSRDRVAEKLLGELVLLVELVELCPCWDRAPEVLVPPP